MNVHRRVKGQHETKRRTGGPARGNPTLPPSQTHHKVVPHTAPEAGPSPPGITRQQAVDLCGPLGLPHARAIFEARVVAQSRANVGLHVLDAVCATRVAGAQCGVDAREGR